MSPAGTSVLAPMCFDSSRMKAKQNLRISLSDLPLGSKSAPPLPPPMFTKKTKVSDHQIEAVICLGMLTAGQCILKDLFESQELENRQVHGGVKAETSFVGTQGGVELHTISSIDLHLSLVVFPDHSELNDSFGDGGDLESSLVFGILFEEGGVLEG